MNWQTERLRIEQMPIEMMRRRLDEEDFVHNGWHYSAEWPGDALALFPLWILQREQCPEGVEWGGMVIQVEECEVIGSIGAKGEPNDGRVEIGYGFNRSAWGKGYATETVRHFSEWLLAQPNVSEVWAETLPSNLASQRVLAKADFVREGGRIDPVDGALYRFVRT